MTDWTALFAALHEYALASPHHSEKIAAQILYPSGQLEEPRFNARPPIVDALNIGQNVKIADRSLYVHAETRAILHARRSTRGATLLVTDPFCPNCAKQIAMAGIARVIVDHKGFEKLYYHKNSEAFSDLSRAILGWAGVSVFVARENNHLERQNVQSPAIRSAKRLNDRAILPVSGSWCGQNFVKTKGIVFDGPSFTDKYNARIEPMVAALMTAKRKGLLPKTLETVKLTHWPATPRSFIDALELGLAHYRVADKEAPIWAKELSALGVSVETD